jgi:hypothetical protein
MDFTTFLHILGMMLGTLLVLVLGTLIRGRFVKSEPNEWMIVLKNGKPLKMGIGISGWIGWYDVVVKFPSQINKVSFQMQQVTNENQGIQISGVLLWSIYRIENGPFLAYQKLGEDLKSGNPEKANDDLRDATYSILREKIANSTIMDVIKNRNKISNSMKKELNSLVNGWGVWVELVQITDVKILSNTLFKNLQTKFREEKRKEAQFVQMASQQELNELRTKDQLEYNRLSEKNRTAIAIAQTEKGVTLETENQKVYDNSMKMETQKDDMKKVNNIKMKEHEFGYYTEKNKIDATIRKTKHAQDLVQLQAEHENDMLRVESDILTAVEENKQATDNEDFERTLKLRELEIRDKVCKGKTMKIKVLESISEMYKSMPSKDISIVNFSKGETNPAMAGLAHAIQSLDVVRDTVSNKK